MIFIIAEIDLSLYLPYITMFHLLTIFLTNNRKEITALWVIQE